MTKKYRKTALVEAEQFNGQPELIEKYDIKQISPNTFTMDTLEGIMHFSKGDYICTGANKEHWAIRESIFEKTYEEVE